jgi:pimeloyl-ACP methyl ester carboxylesterase
MNTVRPKRRLRTALAAIAGALAAAVIITPLARNAEHLQLDDAARKQADGQFVRLSHGMVHYHVAGPADGVPVVLVHGFSVPDYVFDDTRKALADAGFRAVSFDLYGRGWSDRPDVRYDRDLFAGELKELMDALHIQKASIVGLSMGGAVVGHFAAAHPDRVRSLVLMAPFNQPQDISVFGWPGVGEWALRSFYLPAMAKSQGEDFPHPGKLPGWAAKFVPQMQYEGFGRAILSSARNVVAGSSIPDFEKIGKSGLPVELMWGDHDKTLPYEQHTAVQRAIPQAQFVSLQGLGHLALVEDPAAVNPQVVEFLRQH